MAMIQPVYLIPSDAPTRHLERAAIRQIIDMGNRWLAGQTGGRRFRVAGKVIVVRAPWGTGAMRHMDAAAIYRIDQTLPAAPGTINAVFYDAPDTMTGGWATQPPLVPGHTAVISLGRQPAWPDTWWRYFVHETLHALGIGHVTDTGDIMSSPWDGWGPVGLDPDRDDYWDALMVSPFIVTPL